MNVQDRDDKSKSSKVKKTNKYICLKNESSKNAVFKVLRTANFF